MQVPLLLTVAMFKGDKSYIFYLGKNRNIFSFRFFQKHFLAIPFDFCMIMISV